MNSRIELNKDKQKDIDREKQTEKVKKIVKRIVISLIVIFLLVFFTFFYITNIGTTSLVVNEEAIVNSKLPESFSGLKVIQFGDLHYSNNNLLKDVVNAITKRNPDLIFFTGDLLGNEDLTPKNRKKLVKELKRLHSTLGKYAVLGESDNNEAISILVDCGFTILDDNNELITIIESSTELDGNIVKVSPLDGSSPFEVEKDTICSMNMLLFTPSLFNILEEKLPIFLEDNKDNLDSCEFLIPIVLNELLKENRVIVSVIETHANWYGVTYKKDKELVVNAINNMIKDEIYSNNLYGGKGEKR